MCSSLGENQGADRQADNFVFIYNYSTSGNSKLTKQHWGTILLAYCDYSSLGILIKNEIAKHILKALSSNVMQSFNYFYILIINNYFLCM